MRSSPDIRWSGAALPAAALVLSACACAHHGASGAPPAAAVGASSEPDGLPVQGVDFTPRDGDLGYPDGPVKPGSRFRVHDPDEPRPRVVAPGTASTEAQPGEPPSDALVLFGSDADLHRHWVLVDGSPPDSWTAQGGVLTVGKRSLRTRESFQDFQLHLEWSAPHPRQAQGLAGQGRSNSGLILLGQFEVQILDSYRSDTYPDGQAGAMYGQFPPLVNASRPPLRWQTYDVVFFAPRFDAAGALTRPARVTVLHNGVLIHHDRAYFGPVTHRGVQPYRPEHARGPIQLQDHGNPVRFRNIWIRPLRAEDYPGYDRPFFDDAPALATETLPAKP